MARPQPRIIYRCPASCQDDSKELIVLAVDAEEHPSPVKSSTVCPRFDAWAAPTAQRSLRSLVHLKPRYNGGSNLWVRF
ncbi:hypothetical protein E4T56_gene6513 [Termitomyces sp. T112]|nr:hypothetical protein E4T56_gene6513 [Termitomyces sp. T112]